MKKLYVIRHAKSSWKDAKLKDFDRPLNRRGMRDAPFMAKMMKGRNILADRIITSSANRAITTAGYFADEQEMSRNDFEVKNDIYEASTDILLNIIRQLDNQWETVFLFGHNPGLTNLVNMFEGEYISNVPTCGIVGIQAVSEDWAELANNRKGVITEFYYPRQYF